MMSKIKFVKKANMWCKTTFVKGAERLKQKDQKQKWFNTKEEAYE